MVERLPKHKIPVRPPVIVHPKTFTYFQNLPSGWPQPWLRAVEDSLSCVLSLGTSQQPTSNREPMLVLGSPSQLTLCELECYSETLRWESWKPPAGGRRRKGQKRGRRVLFGRTHSSHQWDTQPGVSPESPSWEPGWTGLELRTCAAAPLSCPEVTFSSL